MLSKVAAQDILICPAPAAGLKTAGGAAVASKPDGVFTSYTPTIATVSLTAPTVTKIKTAGPPRNVTAVPASNHLAREPTMEEWHAAQVYNITLKSQIPTAGGDYKLAIDCSYRANLPHKTFRAGGFLGTFLTGRLHNCNS